MADTVTVERRSSRSPTWVDEFIGRRIQQRRIEIGLSQYHLAANVGLTFQQIQKFEAGINRVPASRLFDIAAVLAAAPGDFFPETNEEAPQLRQGDVISAQAAVAEIIGRHQETIGDLHRLYRRLGHLSSQGANGDAQPRDPDAH